MIRRLRCNESDSHKKAQKDAKREGIFMLRLTLSVVCVAFMAVAAAAAEPGETGWTTYRGNVQRTGNTDNLAGPAAPKVLWAFKAQEHFIASPVPHGDRLFVSALGGFNVPT